jgi:hypothetical protein
VADEPVLDQPMTDGPKPNSVVDCAVYVAGFVWIGLFEPDEQLLQSGQL